MIVGLFEICMLIPFWNAVDAFLKKMGLFRKLRTGALSALTSNVVNRKVAALPMNIHALVLCIRPISFIDLTELREAEFFGVRHSLLTLRVAPAAANVTCWISRTMMMAAILLFDRQLA
jgi:hypothetical protein